MDIRFRCFGLYYEAEVTYYGPCPATKYEDASDPWIFFKSLYVETTRGLVDAMWATECDLLPQLEEAAMAACERDLKEEHDEALINRAKEYV